jgi:ribonucleoside-diphosphate reductase alpha chain
MKIIKRNGKKEKFELAKWQAHIAKMCEGIEDVSPSMIEIHASPQFYDGMTTEELDAIALRAEVNLIDETSMPGIANVNYQKVAGRHLITMLRKKVYGEYEVPHILEIVKRNVGLKLYTAELLDWYSEEEWDSINEMLDHSRDEKMDYAAVDQLIEKYLVQNRATKEVYESPQIRYIISAATLFHAEKENRLQWVKDYYDSSSLGEITQSTPVCAGLGTPTKQFSSCTLMSIGDSKESIYRGAESIAEYASNRAGIGIEIGSIRPLGAPVRNGEIKHTGLVPFLHKWFRDLRAFSQGGIRNSSMTVAYPIWHYQFEDLIVLKNNQGTEESRVRHVDYDVVMSAFFWRRYKNQGQITLFDPAEVPDLYKAFYSNPERFEQLYEQYEKDSSIKRKKTLPAATIIDMFVSERSDTGRIYVMNVDNVIRQGVFDSETHPVLTSNLCMEILIPVVAFATWVKKEFKVKKEAALNFVLNLPKQYANPRIKENN